MKTKKNPVKNVPLLPLGIESGPANNGTIAILVHFEKTLVIESNFM